MELSEEAKKELDDISYFLLSATDHILDGVLKIRMTPLLQHPYSISFFHPEITENPKEADRMARLFKKIDLTDLRELMTDEINGAWFSITFELDCDENWNVDIDDKDLKVTFNYDERFNVFGKDWRYDSKDLVFPTVDYFLDDLKKHPRSSENYPSTLQDLVEEEKIERESFIATDMREVLREYLSITPVMHLNENLSDGPNDWLGLWRDTAIAFERMMIVEKYRSRPFVDPRYGFMKRDCIIWNSRDLANRMAREHAEYNYTITDAMFYNGSARVIGLTPHPGMSFDFNDLEPENVRRAFSNLLYDLIMLQNKQRFAKILEIK